MEGLSKVDFWKRLGAFLIDFLILYTFAPLLLALLCLSLKISPPVPSVTNPAGMMIMGGLFLVICWLYFAGTESSHKQASLGKRILGIMVTDLHGNKISFSKASLRFWGKFTVFPGFSLTGLVLKKRALHDIMAKTLVVKKSRLGAEGLMAKGKVVSLPF